MAYIARRYYLEDQKQSDIARELGISRPLVSRILSEARELGVVEITIHDPEAETAGLLERLRQTGAIQGGILVEDGEDNDATNQLLSKGAVELLQQLGTRRLGVGWGYLIGQLVTWLEKHPQPDSPITDICPLVGNASIPARNYQSNENVRLMAQQLGATPHFLYLPALPESLEEKQLLCSTEIYRRIDQEWQQLDTALVNLGDYPSSPDFASLVRYGNLLQQQHACGRMLVYYYNEAGTVIQSEQDFAIQIPMETLKRCPRIIGVCSANTSVKALRGALQSGFLTHIVTRADLVKTLLHETVT
ncbi:MAG TPA: transcriptional regulator [Candidatus Flavonifractor intestinipullorum]|uniref:Transcriptional regulator n=1 Tax=Candidatus Flavonifractor intestinipullorum TaxID=2838587 RepID=A0A9D2MA84_9FIRM|nr:transcriptional regulator [Candidatus Flavonifractor intestinipullorum]